MRKPIALTLDYLAVIFSSLLVGLFFYTQYFNSISLVAGRTSVFSKEIIVYGLFECLPIIFITIPMFMIFYKIRHQGNPVSSCITFSCLCVFTWFFLYPVTISFQSKVYKMLTPKDNLESKQNLSGGYFRKINGKTYYFINDADNDIANVVELFDSKDPMKTATIHEIDISIVSSLEKNDNHFQEPIIKEYMTEVPFNLVELCDFTKNRAQNAWRNGILSWLCFCSFGFALCSAYSLIKVSSWKLVNAFWVLVANASVIWFNYHYFLPRFYFFRTVMQHFFYDSGHLNYFTAHEIDFPLMLINILYGTILTVAGILLATSKRNKY